MCWLLTYNKLTGPCFVGSPSSLALLIWVFISICIHTHILTTAPMLPQRSRWRQAVKAAGPFMVTLGFFVILPLVWQLPICFITAELTTTFQVIRLPSSRAFLCVKLNLFFCTKMHWLVYLYKRSRSDATETSYELLGFRWHGLAGYILFRSTTPWPSSFFFFFSLSSVYIYCCVLLLAEDYVHSDVRERSFFIRLVCCYRFCSPRFLPSALKQQQQQATTLVF